MSKMARSEVRNIRRIMNNNMHRLEREAKAEVILYGHNPGNFLRWSYAPTDGGFERMGASLWCKDCGGGIIIKYKPEEGAKDIQGVLIRDNCRVRLSKL